MSYYPTIEEDLARAKEILAKGRTAIDSLQDVQHGLRVVWHADGEIVSADIYAAYKLLESFVAEIELLQQKLSEAFDSEVHIERIRQEQLVEIERLREAK